MPDSTITLLVPGGIDIVVQKEGDSFRIDGVRAQPSHFANSTVVGLSSELKAKRFRTFDEVIDAVGVELLKKSS